MRQKKRERILFLIQIALILLCGAILSVLAFVALRERNLDRDFNSDSSPVYLVTFAELDGTVIAAKTAHEGKGVLPPEYETDGVFRGWSSPFNAVTSNVETHPMVYQVADENLFCFDSVYTQEGKQFEVSINVTGTVNISSAVLTIKYDPLVMEYIDSEDSEYCVVSEDEPGKLTLDLKSKTPIREAVLLSKLTFFAKPEDVYSTQVNLHCADAKLITDAGAIPATVSTLNNEIFYLQEVE